MDIPSRAAQLHPILSCTYTVQTSPSLLFSAMRRRPQPRVSLFSAALHEVVVGGDRLAGLSRVDDDAPLLFSLSA